VPIFCLDTSTREGSMALWRTDAAVSVVHRDPRSHAERLPTEALAWLAELNVTARGGGGGGVLGARGG